MVGDIIELHEGDHVPCDTLVIEGFNSKVSQSHITGEPGELIKTDLNELNAHMEPDPFLLATSKITTGAVKGLICCVGKNMLKDQSLEKFEDRNEGKKTSSVHSKLKKIATLIGKIGVCCALLTFLTCMLYLIIS